MHSRLLVIDCAALGWRLLEQEQMTSQAGLCFRKAKGPFPAVTCTAQADFRTGLAPTRHGMIANGRYFPELAKVLFWEQSAKLVEAERFWKIFREAGRKVAMLFWQQSLAEQVDVVLSPAPIHKHHGGMIQDCYSQPAGLYDRLCRKIGSRFKLRNYWGPLASAKVGDWIARATAAVMEEQGCDLVLTYLPTLDYDLQRHGPRSRQARKALEKLFVQISLLMEAADALGYEVLVFGDYAIVPSNSAAIFPNRHLLQTGWMHQRKVQGRSYPDLYTSRAFAMVDHEIAHVFVSEAADVPAVAENLSELSGVASVLTSAELADRGLDHPNAGQIVLEAEEGTWLAYPWWTEGTKPPDYARHIDIHNKPGFDPCELFFGRPPGITLNTQRIRGTHGRIGPGREIAWACTTEMENPTNLLELSRQSRSLLERMCR